MYLPIEETIVCFFLWLTAVANGFNTIDWFRVVFAILRYRLGKTSWRNHDR